MRSERQGSVVRHFTYANVMSTLAVFLVVVAGGTALAATVHKNSVNSKSIKNNVVQSRDLKDGSAVASSDVIDNSLTGKDIDESTLTVSPKGAAGGGLTGTYPDPTIGSNSVGSGNVIDNSIGEGDLGPSSVTSSKLGVITRVQSSITINATSNGTGITLCPAGQIALSGGARSAGAILKLFAMSKENVSEAWVVEARNDSGVAATLTTFVYCLAA